MRKYVTFLLLTSVQWVSRVFYRHDLVWIGDHAIDPWSRPRLLVFLNHTSLYEPLFAGAAPSRLMWRIAAHGVIPAADKTIRRRFVGLFFRFIAKHVVAVTREPDHTWQAVLDRIERDSMVIILPEGRMKRANGLDLNGNPMTVRGGVADILQAIPEGEMLIVYSGGLHHVQIPGQRLPRPFKRLRLAIEQCDIRRYREQLLALAGPDRFKNAVKQDLEQRRDRYCPAVLSEIV